MSSALVLISLVQLYQGGKESGREIRRGRRWGKKSGNSDNAGSFFSPVPKPLVLRARLTVWSILHLKKRPSDKPPNS